MPCFTNSVCSCIYKSDMPVINEKPERIRVHKARYALPKCLVLNMVPSVFLADPGKVLPSLHLCFQWTGFLLKKLTKNRAESFYEGGYQNHRDQSCFSSSPESLKTSRNSKQNSTVKNVSKAGTVLHLVCSALGREALTQPGELVRTPPQAEVLVLVAPWVLSSSWTAQEDS